MDILKIFESSTDDPSATFMIEEKTKNYIFLHVFISWNNTLLVNYSSQDGSDSLIL